MILQPCSVELKRIYYYEKEKKPEENWVIPTISSQVDNQNIIIKKNIFGHRWVLKINENSQPKKSKPKLRVILYVLVVCSLIIAVVFGILASIEKIYGKHYGNETYHTDKNAYEAETKRIKLVLKANRTLPNENNSNLVINETSSVSVNESHLVAFCSKCIITKRVCMKKAPHQKPECVKPTNENDPTGCGGLCKVNTHYCQILDNKARVHQCSLLKNILRCPNNTFNCGNMCILPDKRCDGRIDCSDGSDERNCSCDLRTHFQCGNYTSCLENHRKCDKKVDCWDKSDEINCHIIADCSEQEIPCYDGQCISKASFCDGKYDCTDKSDEPDGCQ